MPPTSNMRTKPMGGGGGVTTTVSHINDFGAAASASAPQRRTASGRAVRVNTTRPSNYYARPFGSFAAPDSDAPDPTVAPGFYPAMQFFTDAITALPKEMARQFTVMNEAQAKIHAPSGRFQDMLDRLLELPVPASKGGNALNGNGLASLGRGMLSFTGNNSLSGSASASVVNGGAAGHSNAASVDGEEENIEEDLARRQKYHEMGNVLKEMLPNMEEKNNGLLEAIRRLNLQLSRIDSVLPYIDEEISEEARYGSMTHWAYSDNRQRKQVPPTGVNRRDVAATNSLAAAANAIHETEIAQARREATRENAREKHKGRAKDMVDSDFDDKPKKTHAKVAKSKTVGQAGPSGLGISGTGEPAKRRKVDKGLAAPAMERSASGPGKGAKSAAAKEGARSTPNAEPAKKSAKAKPLPAPLKRKGINSAHASPALASSPLHSSFTASMEPANGRPQTGRYRQNSTTNLRHERVAGESAKRPDSSAGKTNGDKVGAKRKVRPDEEEHTSGPDDAKRTIEMDDEARQEGDEAKSAHPSRSGSNSGKAGRGSNTGTPKNESFPDVPQMKRTRSTRSMRGNRDESSSEPQQVRGKHRRHVSNSHLVKQLAPYNRSPDLDRNRSSAEEDDGEAMDGIEQEGEKDEDGDAKWRRSPRKRRPTSRRNTTSERPGGEGDDMDEGGAGDRSLMGAMSPLRRQALNASPSPIASDQDEPPALSPANSPTPPAVSPTPPPTHSPPHPTSSRPSTPTHHSGSDDDDEEQDPDSPSATRYCYCDRGSYGEMIGCDNPQCPREWFHLGCTDLREMPGEDEKWYCRDCRPIFAAREGKRGRGRGGGNRGGK